MWMGERPDLRKKTAAISVTGNGLSAWAAVVSVFGSAMLLVVLARPSPSMAQQEEGDFLTRVRQLVLDLDHPELARREEAEQQLLELGPRVLSLLPSPDRRMPAEMRQRLLRIRQVLQVQTARQSLQASTVSYEGQATLQELFQTISEQTGNAISDVPSPAASQRCDVSWKDVEFWKAVDHLLEVGRLQIDHLSGRPHILVLQGSPPNWTSSPSYTDYQGPFRIRAVRIVGVRDLRSNLNNLRVQISFAWEPRLTPLAVSYLLDQLEATDEMGESLVDPETRGAPEIPVQSGMTGVEFELPLRLPENDRRRIQRLAGAVNVLLPSQRDSFVFEGDWFRSRNVVQRKATVVVVLDEVRRSGDLYQVRLRLRFDDAAGALESHRGWVFQNQAYLIDKQSKRVDHIGMETTRQAENEVGVAYLFDRPEGLDGCKFVYETPVLLVKHPVTFEIKDLPLP
ncbi:MAG: hypothetical protein KatS3mg110_2441 [Pirellulaceae bacterium]|nr:MAG: hypothetical protein KatS3mg110_2441 [Pirellulaceae bacterium]